MRSSIILPIALLAASVVAHPHHGAGHRHAQRDTIEYDSNGDVVEEVVVVKTVTKSSEPTAGGEKKYAVHHEEYHWAPPPAPTTSSTPPPPPPVETPPPESTPAPSSTQEAAASPAGDSNPTGTGPVPGPSNINVAGSDTWDTAPNSMGKSILGTANYWRKVWAPNTTDFVWDETLAGNARQTTVLPVTNGQNEGGASQMNHHLFPGSNAQCINEGDGDQMNGDLTPFEVAWLGWLCEEPQNGIPCDKINESYGGDVGHAQIIIGDVNKIGCYYMDSTTPSPNFKGMWTCDFTTS